MSLQHTRLGVSQAMARRWVPEDLTRWLSQDEPRGRTRADLEATADQMIEGIEALHEWREQVVEMHLDVCADSLLYAILDQYELIQIRSDCYKRIFKRDFSTHLRRDQRVYRYYRLAYRKLSEVLLTIALMGLGVRYWRAGAGFNDREEELYDFILDIRDNLDLSEESLACLATIVLEPRYPPSRIYVPLR